MHDRNGLMKGAVLTRDGHFEIQSLEVPEPGPDEVRIRLRKAGICGSDIHIFAGHFTGIPHPLTTGHEGLGVIEKCGANVPSERLGQRVVIEPNFPCLECRYCKRGQGNICPKKRIFGVRETGCFAEFAVVPSEFVWAIPDSIVDDDAVMIEPSAVALHALKMCSNRPGSAIAVIGMGPIGLLATQFALSLGYKVFVHDLITQKLDLPVSWGAVSPSDALSEISAEQLKTNLTDADVLAVIEATGSGKGTSLALDCAPRGAEVVLVGLSTETIPVVPSALTRNGTQTYTSMIYDHPNDFREVIDLIAGGKVEPRRIISSRTVLDRVPQTFEMLLTQYLETKVIIDFE